LIKSWLGQVELEQPSEPMAEYYALQRRLQIAGAGLAVLCFGAICLLYSFNTALSYLLGAFTGMVYFHLLGRSVASLGGKPDRFANLRFPVIMLALIISIKLQMLEVVPTFLGLMTFKVAILLDALRDMYRDAIR